MLLIFGDRYLIQFYLGFGAVGVYSAAYSLSRMAQSLLTSPLRLAAIPMYLKIWNSDGGKETTRFLTNLLDIYFMLGIPIVIGLSWLSKDVVTLLASSKFRESSLIVPYIILSEVLFGTNIIFAAGLRIHKKTVVLMALSMTAAVVNVGLNILLIPMVGIMGAAYATLTTYMLLVTLIALKSHKYLKIKIASGKILKYITLSVVTMLLVSLITLTGMQGLLLKTAVGALFYMSVILISDKRLKRHALSFLGG